MRALLPALKFQSTPDRLLDELHLVAIGFSASAGSAARTDSTISMC
jgi:hypothetical protein